MEGEPFGVTILGRPGSHLELHKEIKIPSAPSDLKRNSTLYAFKISLTERHGNIFPYEHRPGRRKLE